MEQAQEHVTPRATITMLGEAGIRSVMLGAAELRWLLKRAHAGSRDMAGEIASALEDPAVMQISAEDNGSVHATIASSIGDPMEEAAWLEALREAEETARRTAQLAGTAASARIGAVQLMTAREMRVVLTELAVRHGRAFSAARQRALPQLEALR